MAGTPVATGVVPLFVPTNTTDQTAAAVRYLTQALVQNSGYGVLGSGSFSPTPNSSQARTAAGTALVPATSGYYLVRTTTTKNMVPEINNDVATRTDELVLEVNETTEVAQLTIYKSGDTKSHPYISIAEVDVAPGGSTTVTAVRDLRTRSQERTPQGYNVFYGRKGLAEGVNTTFTNQTPGLTVDLVDPGDVLDTSVTGFVRMKTSGLYAISMSAEPVMLNGGFQTMVLNKNDPNVSGSNPPDNIIGQAFSGYGGAFGPDERFSALHWSGLRPIQSTEDLRVWCYSTSSTPFYNISLSLHYIAPIPSGRLDTGLVLN